MLNYFVVSNPYYYPTILSAYTYLLYSSREIIIVGKRDQVEEILNLINNKYNPNRVILLKSEEATLNDTTPFTAEMKKLENKPTLYIFAKTSPVNYQQIH